MKPSDVIESYVRDVAAQLPAAKRADVAAELRSLLAEELGNGDAAAALEMVRRFGRPADVAARYSTPTAVVDPADTRSFVLAAVAGALLIPSTNLRLPFSIDPARAQVWFLAWLGALVILFALKSWIARRRPDWFRWKPSPVRDYDRARAIEQLPLIGILLFYEVVYLSPGPVIHLLSGGRVDAGLLSYTSDFASPLRMLWFALFLPVLVVLEVLAMVQSRWTRLTRSIEIMLFLLVGTQLGWHASYGDIFANVAAEHGARMAFQLVGAAFILTAVYKTYREWGRIPAPR
jgi:predicted nucleic acid-binding protein